MIHHRCVLFAFFVLSNLTLVSADENQSPIDFNSQIRPLLSDRCFACHGPDEKHREGGFRLDEKESAFGEADSGEKPIVPGDPDASELLLRLISDDESEQMPPRNPTNH